MLLCYLYVAICQKNMISSKKNILLVGGTGVLSSAVVSEALKRDFSVTIITRGNRKLPEGTTNIICDKDDHNSLLTQLKPTYDAVIDFLCYTDSELEKSFKFFSQYTKQYIFISTCAVYNTKNGGVYNEDSPKMLSTWKYSVDKWNAELKLVELAKHSSCNYTIVRPAITYDNTRLPYGIMPSYGYHWTLCARILAEKPIIVWNEGSNTYNMLRVEDFAIGLVGLLGNSKAYNEAFNVCGDESPSFKDVLSIVEDYLGRKAIVLDMKSEYYASLMPNKAEELLGGRSINVFFSNDKLKSVVPEFKQTISLRDGVRMTLKNYVDCNYQSGIDYVFDGETDKIAKRWCEEQNIVVENYQLCFIDYLGNATLLDRWNYYNASNHDHIIMKVLRKLKKIFNL